MGTLQINVKKILITSLVFLFFLGGMGITASAADANGDSTSVKENKIIKEANEVAKKYGYEPLRTSSTSQVTDFKGKKRLEFDSVEEFKNFLEKQKELEESQDNTYT